MKPFETFQLLTKDRIRGHCIVILSSHSRLKKLFIKGKKKVAWKWIKLTQFTHDELHYSSADGRPVQRKWPGPQAKLWRWQCLLLFSLNAQSLRLPLCGRLILILLHLPKLASNTVIHCFTSWNIGSFCRDAVCVISSIQMSKFNFPLVNIYRL